MSKLDVNIFKYVRDIMKCQRYLNNRDDNDKAWTIPKYFLLNPPSKKYTNSIILFFVTGHHSFKHSCFPI